ncbi:MAG: GDP-mannose 4,6-dehydratase [Bdellovibrionota bacterium]
MKALITGITGQDGSYLAEFLIAQGYRVYGVVRRSSTEKYDRIAHIRDRLVLVQADLLDQVSLSQALKEIQPDEIYNLGAQSFVPTSLGTAGADCRVYRNRVTRMLEAIRADCPKARFYQASSSEMFGMVRETSAERKKPLSTLVAHGVAKVYGHHITVNYRESYGLFAVSGILFNHESPRRGLEFVTRK